MTSVFCVGMYANLLPLLIFVRVQEHDRVEIVELTYTVSTLDRLFPS